jgi:hypothetical protein
MGRDCWKAATAEIDACKHSRGSVRRLLLALEKRDAITMEKSFGSRRLSSTSTTWLEGGQSRLSS